MKPFTIELEDLNSFQRYSIQDKNKLPHKQGIYLLSSYEGIVYVGSTSNFYNRLISHAVYLLKKIEFIYIKEIEDYLNMITQEKLYMYYYFKQMNNSHIISNPYFKTEGDLNTNDLDLNNVRFDWGKVKFE